jgi:fibronectin-binding autotransporter adhesin
MKRFYFCLALGCVFSMTAVSPSTHLRAAESLALPSAWQFDLVPASSSVNRLSVNISNSYVSNTQTTDLSGFLTTNFGSSISVSNYDRSISFSSGSTIGFQYDDPGNIHLSNMHFSFSYSIFGHVGDAYTTNLLMSPFADGGLNSDGTFDMSEHGVAVNSGTYSYNVSIWGIYSTSGSGNYADGQSPGTMVGTPTGTASLTFTRYNDVSWTQSTYNNFTLTAPVSWSADLNGQATETGSGTLQAVAHNNPSYTIDVTPYVGYWDRGSAAGLQAGSGTWSTTAGGDANSWACAPGGNVSYGASASGWSYYNGTGLSGDSWYWMIARFDPSGTQTINVSGDVCAYGLEFNGTGYTLNSADSNGKIHLSRDAYISTGQDTTINAILAGCSDGTAGFTKTGGATLTLGGSYSNTLGTSGTTTVKQGNLILAKTGGAIAIPGNINLTNNNDGNSTFTILNGDNQIASTAIMTFTTTSSGWAHFELHGQQQTLGGISATSTFACIEDVQDETANNGTLIINTVNSTDIYTYSGIIRNHSAGSGILGIIKQGPGTQILAGTSDWGDHYGSVGNTEIQGGALQADRGVGLAVGSCVVLNGGVLQSNSAITFTDKFWNDANDYIISWQSGGFAAGGGKMTVLLYNDTTHVVAFGTDPHSSIAGTMILNSVSAQYETEFQNPLNLNGGARTIQVDDNPNSTGDFATLSGMINDLAGGASLTKSGKGTLYITGAASNAYTGGTTFTGGTVYLAKTGGAIAIPGNINIADGAARTYLILNGSNEIASSCVFSSVTPIYYGDLELNGYSQTLAGISSDAWATISNNTTGSADSTLTVNNDANYTFGGKLVDRISGSGTGRLILVKGGSGTLTFTNTGNAYTGGTTISGGTLQIGDGTNNGSLPGNVTDNAALAFIVAASTTVAYTGNISGTGVVNKLSAGTLALGGSSANTYSGLTTVNAGTLLLDKSSGNAIANGGLTIGDGTNAATVQYTGTSSDMMGTGTVTINLNGTLDFNGKTDTIGNVSVNGSSTTVGQISNTAGGGALTVGTLGFTGGGTVATGTGSLVLGGTVTYAAGSTNSTTTIAGNLNLGGTTRSFNVVDISLATEMDVSAVVSNGALTKSGAGTLALSGSSANTYGGLTTVSSGRLLLAKSSGNAIAGGGLTIGDGTNGATVQYTGTSGDMMGAGAVTINRNAALDFNGKTDTIGNVSIYGNNSSIGLLTNSAGGGALTVGTLSFIGGGRVLTDTGKMVLGGNVSYATATNGAMVTITSNVDLNANRTFTIADDSALSSEMDVSAVLANGSGVNGLIKDGPGTLTFSGNVPNTYGGLTSLNAGTLLLAKTGGANAIANGGLTIGGNALATVRYTGSSTDMMGNGAVTITHFGILDFNGKTDAIGNVAIAGYTGSFGQIVNTAGGGALTLGTLGFSGGGAVATGSGKTVLGGNVTYSTVVGGATATISGNVDLNATRTFTVADDATLGSELTVSAVIANGAGGSNGLIKEGLGELTLTGNNTFSGSVTINHGTLALAGNGQISGSIANNDHFEISEGTVSHTVGAITGTGTTQVLDGGQLTSSSITQGTLTIGGSRALSDACSDTRAQPVPEPSVWILLVLAGLGYLGVARRRK